MSDFTKEELKDLALSTFHSSWIWKSDKSSLIKKLEEMIESYDNPEICHHKTMNPSGSICKETGATVMFCFKCEEYFE